MLIKVLYIPYWMQRLRRRCIHARLMRQLARGEGYKEGAQGPPGM